MTFAEIAKEIGALVEEKNKAYGDSFKQSGEIMKILYPQGIQPEQYTDMLGIVRVIDKLFRIATDKDALGESPWRDIAGYGILGAEKKAERKIIAGTGVCSHCAHFIHAHKGFSTYDCKIGKCNCSIDAYGDRVAQ